MFKWVAAVFSLIIALIVASVILTITGVIQPQAAILEYGHSVSWIAPHLEIYAIGQENQSWLSEKEQTIALAWSEIEDDRLILIQEKQQLEDWEARLDRQEQDLINAKSFSQSVTSLATLYSNMRTEEAVEIMELLDSSLLLDVLQSMDIETAALILASFPRELAAELSGQFNH